ncbi:methionyl-tRNA formyltransferase [Methylophaga muralis]|uniref:Methionyl-tRNA formyltransferase n=1 Tax=Methylophaga muralis TaxID=291169 RepID=A0A1E3GY50_9GAMM|nr:methionyl-tRNA formyltransferase [Methylophaga muralis]ODN68271.1 Methionyl-tRNA formyltransferase [Methylophaga muralis]
MRIIFAGTPDFAATTLAALLTTEHEICAVYSQPDRPAGRGRKLTASPVKQLALQHHITVEQPLNFKQETDREKLARYQADLMIVVAYGLLLPQIVLDTPRLGCINVHASLLPRWRGAAPIQRAILAGDSKTGICIMQMEAGLDTGPVLQRAEIPIEATDTGEQLHDKLAKLGADTLLETLNNFEQLQAKASPQNDAESCYAAKLQKAEANIDWLQSALQIDRQIRAFNSWPVAQTLWQDKMLRIWNAAMIDHHDPKAIPGTIIQIDRDGIDIATGDGVIRVLTLQAPGKKAMPVRDFLNAHVLKAGDHFG